MMQQAKDFLDESEAIHNLVEALHDQEMQLKTGFKDWTINEIIRHLHVWNMAAHTALVDPEGFRAFVDDMKSGMKEYADKGPSPVRAFEAAYLDGLSGPDLRKKWRAFYRDMARDFGEADPSARVEWVGPAMSVRSSITARLMESWSHAQAIYDALGKRRDSGDRIGNIVRIGLNTYGWTFKVNGEDAPDPVPYLKLTAPSGDIWEHGDPSETERIEGRAEEFCQVVTQTRNIADTRLEVTGPNATRWMEIAQCFAGPPEKAPAPGTRRIMEEAQ